MSDPRIRLLFTPAELAALGRCADCGWHPGTQGHHPDCSVVQPAAPVGRTQRGRSGRRKGIR